MPVADDKFVASQHDLEVLACRIADTVIAQKFDQAARLIDELAAAVRAVRDNPPADS